MMIKSVDNIAAMLEGVSAGMGCSAGVCSCSSVFGTGLLQRLSIGKSPKLK